MILGSQEERGHKEGSVMQMKSTQDQFTTGSKCVLSPLEGTGGDFGVIRHDTLMESFTASLNHHSFKERTDCYTCMLRYAHTCSQVCYSICHMVSYLDTARVGLPSGTAHTQCTSYLRSLDYSDTGL